ncbi:hypothetical protein INS49_004035 [Diaporthe citri]|uniref:uncharacterized protein n=1 Tax=Diaporthe citri TaxID=83186 RepID=UPI001C7ECA40|nr:uncharacterized protein INS49_004035 [Diaporthe citri]KAG6354954.1 hypothetical protein INS49_004035 [Diaporthe citri]
MINEQDIDTHLPASEESFQAGLKEHTSPLRSMLNLEGQKFAAFAARVLAASHFHQACQHSAKTSSEQDTWHIQSSLYWKRHREIDNDLSILLHCLPEDIKLPNNIRCQNATFVNIIIHTSVICLPRAAISRTQKVGSWEGTVRQSRFRLIAAAEEILNILSMMPDVNDVLQNPMLVFLDQPESAEPDYQRQGNLDLTLRFVILAVTT